MIDDSEKDGNHAAGVVFFLSFRPGQCPLTIYATQLKNAGPALFSGWAAVQPRADSALTDL